ncbi:MAG: MazG family protein [Eubacteriaceae bacterium]|nr:MazG family protein [Eubacteriaceae bacterium]
MKKLYIMGFGPGGKGDVTLGTIAALKKCDLVFARTMVHPSAEILDEYSISYESLDSLYESSENFDSLYDEIVKTVLSCGKDTVGYIVPGSACIAEKAAVKLMNEAECEVEVIPSVSFIDTIFPALKRDAAASFKLIDALSLDEQKPDVRSLNIICQIYDREIAGDVKVALGRYYGDDTPVYMINSAGTQDEKVIEMPLCEIDRRSDTDHLSTLVIPPRTDEESPSDFYSFHGIIGKLRGENGCPWDSVQTHESLTPYVIEEAYEVVDAIDKRDMDSLCEELGDLLLQISLQTKIAEEDEDFDIYDVVRGVSEKMIRRHPHVFAGSALPEDFWQQWDEIKAQEHEDRTPFEEMDSVPRKHPALRYAQKIGKRAPEVIRKLAETDDPAVDALLAQAGISAESGETEEAEAFTGRILFTIANRLKKWDIDPEEALRRYCAGLVIDTGRAEDLLKESGMDTSTASDQEIADAYKEAKKAN